MVKKVILITTAGKIALVDNLDYELELDNYEVLTALTGKYDLTLFRVVSDQPHINNSRNHIASNWLTHLKCPDQLYPSVVSGDIIISEEKTSIDTAMLKILLRFILKDKQEFYQTVKQLQSASDDPTLTSYISHFIDN